MPPEEELKDIYSRLANAEKKLFLLEFRMDELAEYELPIRVANLEPAVRNMSSDAAKIEANVEKLTEAVSSMRNWGLGFVAALSCIVVLLGLIPLIKGLWL